MGVQMLWLHIAELVGYNRLLARNTSMSIPVRMHPLTIV